MKFLTLLVLAASVAAVPHHQGRKPTKTKTTAAVAATSAAAVAAASGSTATTSKGAAKGAAAGAVAGAAAGAAVGGTVTRGAQTLVFTEVNGVPGNECLTFRNNGEIVDAACVNTAADRQITPSTLGGQDVLLVQRSFTAGFRPDLVGVQACVGNNGTTFKALDCASLAANDFVTFDGNNLVTSGGACQSGHDGAAQVTVDQTGQNCADFTTTAVTATAP